MYLFFRQVGLECCNGQLYTIEFAIDRINGRIKRMIVSECILISEQGKTDK